MTISSSLETNLVAKCMCVCQYVSIYLCIVKVLEPRWYYPLTESIMTAVVLSCYVGERETGGLNDAE